MPDLALGLMIGEGDADSHIPPIGPNLVLTTQLGAFMLTEDGFFLEFEF